MSDPDRWMGGNGGPRPEIFLPAGGTGGPAPYIRMRTPTTDDLSRLEGLARSAQQLQNSMMSGGLMDYEVHIEPLPQKHKAFIPAWLPFLLLGCALMIAGFSEMRELPLAGVLVIAALILAPASFVGLQEKREDRTARHWREVAALEMDIYGEYVSAEAIRRFGGGLPQ